MRIPASFFAWRGVGKRDQQVGFWSLIKVAFTFQQPSTSVSDSSSKANIRLLFWYDVWFELWRCNKKFYKKFSWELLPENFQHSLTLQLLRQFQTFIWKFRSRAYRETYSVREINQLPKKKHKFSRLVRKTFFDRSFFAHSDEALISFENHLTSDPPSPLTHERREWESKSFSC